MTGDHDIVGSVVVAESGPGQGACVVMQAR